jgi:hypothetical protein
MALALDHLVIAARTLAEGVAYVEARVGVAMGPGGKHATMGTHNRLLSLGTGRFLEVIAIDPDAAPPQRPRWFTLDRAETRARLAQGPRLIHWVVRTDDIERAAAALAPDPVEILALSRGDFRWRIGVPADGGLAYEGVAPTVIEWEGRQPSEALAESGCRLQRLELRHAKAPSMLQALLAAGLAESEPIEARDGHPGLAAHVSSPRGIVALGE